MKTVDEPESPNFSPDGKSIAFAALRNAVGDIFTRRPRDARRSPTSPTTRSPTTRPTLLARRQVHRLHRARQRQREAVPARSRHRRRRRSSPSARRTKPAAQFIDDHTLVFSSTATDPAVPLEPEVAKNGNIFNIWTLDLKTGELRQYTDARRRQLVADRAERGQDATASRSSATTRASTASARSSARSRCTPPRRPTSARPARSSTSRRRCSTRWWRRTSARRARSRRCSSKDGRR